MKPSLVMKSGSRFEFEPSEFRTVLSHYPSGVTVITANEGTEKIGFTCQSFYSVSLTPPLVSISVMKNSTTWPRVRDAGGFAINVLSDTQKDVSSQFARKDIDRWAGVDFAISPAGNPLLRGTVMWLDCEIHEEVDAGDHIVIIARIREMGSVDPGLERSPLIFYKGQYRDIRALESAIEE